MCRPTYFAVDYKINPWMDPTAPVDVDKAVAQWETLVATYRKLGHDVDFIDPIPGLPDMVFAANGARKIFDLIAKSLSFVVAVAKLHPFSVGVIQISGLLPAHGYGAARAVDVHIAVGSLIDTPGKIEAANHATQAANAYRHSLFHCQALRPLAFDSLHFGR